MCAGRLPAQKLGYNFPGLGPGYVRWLCVICEPFPASFSRYVAQMGPPGTANGRIWAKKVGYDLSTSYAITPVIPVKQSLF